jgi:hypothetical protein
MSALCTNNKTKKYSRKEIGKRLKVSRVILMSAFPRRTLQSKKQKLGQYEATTTVSMWYCAAATRHVCVSV